MASLTWGTSGTISGLQNNQQGNAIALALATLSQGASAPTPASTGFTATSGLLWHDTGNNVINLRDQADGTWIPIGSVDETDKLFTPAIPLGQCKFAEPLSATSLKLVPFQGNRVTFPDGSSVVIPSAGISVANTGLTASTLQYIYLNKTGTVSLVPSPTTHATDATTGIEIMSGDPTKVLVGMVWITAAGQFDTISPLNTRNWFGRHNVGESITNSGARLSTSSTTPIELWTSARREFCIWSDEWVQAHVSGCTFGDGITANEIMFLWIGYDGTATADVVSVTEAIGTETGYQYAAGTTARRSSLAEGHHFATLVGQMNVGTGNFEGIATSSTGGLRYNLDIRRRL
jgi:hypothetical protein